MPVIPVWHPDPAVRESVRRWVKSRGVRVVNCRSYRRLTRLIHEQLVDGVVVDLRTVGLDGVTAVLGRYPRIPLFACSAFRPDDGVLLHECFRNRVHVLVLGVDDAVLGEYVGAHSAGSARRLELREAPRMLRLSEPLQLRVWSAILDRVDGPTRTETLARDLGYSREHLSREFAAGGAPNLKRVIDLARLACAAHLLANPGYTVGNAARILGYSSSSHLAGSAKRIAGANPSALGTLGARGVLARFHRGRTRSRLPRDG